MTKTRIAPTPSGLIHLGNAINFKLIDDFATQNQASIKLRIDDFDKHRSRSEFVDDVFQTLKWLKIKWHEGPQNTEEFYKHYSLQKKQNIYKQIVLKLYEEKKAFTCTCSRSQKDRFNELGGYLGTCRFKEIPFEAGTNSLRIKLTHVDKKNSWLDTLSDFVLWTKEDQASYQLISVTEDSSDKITHIIRGEDLYDSTQAQIQLSKLIGGEIENNFTKIKTFHHPLIHDPINPNEKLSKSKESHSLREMISNGLSYEGFITIFEDYKKDLKNYPQIFHSQST